MPAKDSLNRVCSECGKGLAGKRPTAKTCSPKCRSARSLRIQRAMKAGGEGWQLPSELKALRERVNGEIEDQTKVVIREELRPLVRDAMSEDTLRAIQGMVDLMPEMVDAIQQDLSNHDAKIRQAAYSLLAKYMLGPQGLVLAEQETVKNAKLEVVFPGMERPQTQNGDASGGDTPVAPLAVEPAIDGDAEEVQLCERCGETKPLDEFVPQSDRCLACQADFTKRAQAVLGHAP